jgi:hypothetical protein
VIKKALNNLAESRKDTIFAGVILGGVFEKVENPMLLYGAGTSALIILLIMGYYFLKQALKK